MVLVTELTGSALDFAPLGLCRDLCKAWSVLDTVRIGAESFLGPCIARFLNCGQHKGDNAERTLAEAALC